MDKQKNRNKKIEKYTLLYPANEVYSGGFSWFGMTVAKMCAKLIISGKKTFRKSHMSL